MLLDQNMKTTPLEKQLMDLARPVVEDLGFTLCYIRVIDGPRKTLQVTAENPDTRNLGIDDCAKISREISAAFDVEDPVKSAYVLEVSSPGIDRALYLEKDFEDFAGHEVKIELETPVETGQKRFRGFLEGLKEGQVLLRDGGETNLLPFADIKKAQLVLTDDLLKKGSKSKQDTAQEEGKEKSHGTAASC